MRMASIAWKNLRRRPTRSALTILAIAIGTTAVVSFVGLAESLESSFLALYTGRGADLVVQRRGGTVQLSKGISLSLGDRIRALPHAGEVIGGLMDLVAFEDRDLFMVIVNGWQPECPVLDRVQVTSGRRLKTGDEHCVMLGRILAANLGKQVGDTIEIYAQPFKVMGVFESFSVYENGAVFMLLEELQRQIDRTGQVTGFVVQANPHGDAQSVAALQQEIEAIDPEIDATPCARFVSSLTQMRVTRSMSWVTVAVAVIVGSFGTLNTIAMSVFERRGEIGALRAMGWRQARIAGLILEEAVIMAAAGAAIGIAGGFAGMFFLSHWHVTSGLVQGAPSVQSLCEGVLVALTMAAAGAALPAFRVARMQPARSLRGN